MQPPSGKRGSILVTMLAERFGPARTEALAQDSRPFRCLLIPYQVWATLRVMGAAPQATAQAVRGVAAEPVFSPRPNAHTLEGLRPAYPIHADALHDRFARG